MPGIDINTSQNVLISHSPASIGKRILAQIIDFIVMGVYSFFIVYITEIFHVKTAGVMVVFFLPVIFYSFISELFLQGQSLGKMVLKIRVVKMDGSQATAVDYFLRWILRMIDITFYGSVAIITIAINGKGQRLGDLAAGTTVIDMVPKNIMKNSIYRKLPEDYKPKFKEVDKLEEKDIKIINKVLNHYRRNYSQATAEMLKNASEAVEKKMGVENKMAPEGFLETVMKDYNFMVKESVKNELY